MSRPSGTRAGRPPARGRCRRAGRRTRVAERGARERSYSGEHRTLPARVPRAPRARTARSWRSTCSRTSSSSTARTTLPRSSSRTLQEQARAAGLWAPHMPAEAGGTGEGFLYYACMNEEIGRAHWAQLVFGCQAPDAGNAEILHQFGTAEQKDAVPRAARGGAGTVVLLDDRARRGRLRPDPAAHEGGARRRRVGDRRPQVVLERRRGRRPSGSCSRSPIPMPTTYKRGTMILVPADAPGTHDLTRDAR